MKILFLSEDFPPHSFGGGGISAYELALGVRALGHDVSVVTTVRRGEDAGEEEFDGMRVFRIQSDYHERWRAWRGLYNPRVLGRLKKILAEVQPDVVHANNIHFHISWWALPLCRRYARVVWTGRDVMPFNYIKLDTKRYLDHLNAHTTWLDHVREARLRYNPLRNMVIKWCLRFAHAKFAVSKALAIALAQNGIQDVGVIHTGLDSAVWDIPQDRIDAFKGAHGLTGKKVIFFGGRLSPSKGGAVSIAAMAQLARAHPDAVLLVVGKIDRYAEFLKSEGVRLGIGEKLRFIGWVGRDEAPVAYAAADIVWVPSICFDSLPRNVLEAMASGKPVITSRYGGSPEAVVHGETGFVVEVREPSEIALPTIELLSAPERARAMGERGRERIRKEFSLTEMARRYEAAYREN